MKTDRIECPSLRAAEIARQNYIRAGWRCFSIFQSDTGLFCFMAHR